MKRLNYLLMILTAASLLAVPLLAGGQFATIYGQVTDIDGTILPGISVTLTSSSENIKRLAITPPNGKYRFSALPPGEYELVFELEGINTVIRKGIIVKAGDKVKIDATLSLGSVQETIIVTDVQRYPRIRKSSSTINFSSNQYSKLPSPSSIAVNRNQTYFNTEDYSQISDNKFKKTVNDPLSTFSIDVDTASYANIRRMIENHQLPEKDAVRIEEMVNYFTYDYPLPMGEEPFSIVTEISTCPWNTSHRLVHIGLQGKAMEKKDRPPSNLVFLLDVSGSMDSPLKLPLVKAALRLLVRQMEDKDRVAIVVYAGAAGVVLPSTKGHRQEKIMEAIESLYAGGSTAGGEGILLAYNIAKKNFIKNGNNRIILATDGDFNVGISDTPELVKLVEEKRKSGIFLTVLGFGMGNLKVSRMEQLADKGNGNYYYIDGLMEAKKVFIDELGSTLFTIARDVKIQVEFNPVKVESYRLIGYENRMLEKEDFDDDKKDAGELGAGHKVTALYEVIPTGSKKRVPPTSGLKYQETRLKPEAVDSREIMTVKLRYKPPKGEKSELIVKAVPDNNLPIEEASGNFRFSAAVAQFAMLLRDSEFKGKASFESVLKLAVGAKGEDGHGYRAEFIKLVELCRLLK